MLGMAVISSWVCFASEGHGSFSHCSITHPRYLYPVAGQLGMENPDSDLQTSVLGVTPFLSLQACITALPRVLVQPRGRGIHTGRHYNLICYIQDFCIRRDATNDFSILEHNVHLLTGDFVGRVVNYTVFSMYSMKSPYLLATAAS